MRSGLRRMVAVGVLVLVAPAAHAGSETTGTTADDPLAADECPEVYPELDPADPIGTLYGPEPAEGRDLCATWITSEWRGYGEDAELRHVTFGLRTLGDVDLGPDRSFAFSWDVPTSYDNAVSDVLGDDGYCRTTVWVTDGRVQPSVSFRGCGSPTVDYLVGGPVQAEVDVRGDVLEIRVRVPSAPAALAASLVNGNTLWSFGAQSYLLEPWGQDSILAGDTVLVPPEEPAD